MSLKWTILRPKSEPKSEIRTTEISPSISVICDIILPSIKLPTQTQYTLVKEKGPGIYRCMETP